jgi:hypothetical protein
LTLHGPESSEVTVTVTVWGVCHLQVYVSGVCKVTGPSPLWGSTGVRQKGGLHPEPPPPVVPDPESLTAQAAYTEVRLEPELFPGVGPPRTCYRVPYCEQESRTADCPGEEEPPAWEAPAAQISQRAPSPQGRGRLTHV